MKNKFIEAVRLFLIILFVYTATNKIITIDSFTKGLGRFPMLRQVALYLAYAIPTIEIGISLLLIVPKTSRYGFWFAIILMSAFTVYLGLALTGNYELPCSCGGIISNLSWTQHLFFNLGVIFLIATVLLKIKKETY